MAAGNSVAELQVINKLNVEDSKPKVSLVSPLNQGEPIVTRRELWSYYSYFTGVVAGIPIFSTLTIFQSLATSAGYDPVRGPGSSCLDARASGKCVLPWGSGMKPVSSVILLSNGISFAMITLILTTLGPASDYGSFGRWVLLVATLIYWGSMFATMTLTSTSRWGVAMGLYTIGFISYGLTTAFYIAIFPRLARNTQHIRGLREIYEQGDISADEYEQAEALEKSKVTSFCMAFGILGAVIILLLELAILYPLQGNAKLNNYYLLLASAIGTMTGIWWFIFEQPRPGPELPKGEHYLTIGWKQIWIALKQYKKLPNTFTFLFAYFLFADGVNTTMTLVQICQNARFTFSFLEITYLDLVQAGTSIVGLMAYWYTQRYWKIDSKKMFIVTNVVAIVLPLWGMIGIWTNKLGYHNRWEFWAHNAVFGIFQMPYASFSIAVMAELSPPGFDFMFFALFGLTNRASSIIGPNVIQAIVDKTGNTWHGFPFLFAICFASSLVIWLAVDVPKGRRDAECWAAEQRGTADDRRSVGKE